MLMPKRVKRRRVFRGRMKGKATRGNTISQGEYGLVAMEPCWVTSQQIEAWALDEWRPVGGAAASRMMLVRPPVIRR